MAYHDTDPNTTNRAEPVPQAPDGGLERYADGTTAITNKRNGSSGPYASTKDATFKVFDGTYNRVVAGLLPDGTYGIKISQIGYDVATATDSQLVLSSAFNGFKIVKSGTISLLKGASSTLGSVTIAHERSSVPNVMAFGGFRGGSYTEYYSLLPLTVSRSSGADSGKVLYNIGVTVDATNITLFLETPDFASNTFYTSAMTVAFRYYILEETIAAN